MSRNIARSVEQAWQLPVGPVRKALLDAAEQSAMEAATQALDLALSALTVADLGDTYGALALLSWAGSEADQAVEVGWSWAMDGAEGAA